MKLKILTVLIARSMATKIPREIRAYELPILEQVHGSDALEVVEERACEVPHVDPKSELQRLEALYGTHAKKDTAFARMAYRNADELEDAIAEATVADELEAERPARRRKSADADSE